MGFITDTTKESLIVYRKVVLDFFINRTKINLQGCFVFIICFLVNLIIMLIVESEKQKLIFL